MPDLKNFSVTALSNATISVPRAQLSGQVVSSDPTQTVIADFTGANAVVFPNVLGSLSVSDRLELVELIATWLLKKRGVL